MVNPLSREVVSSRLTSLKKPDKITYRDSLKALGKLNRTAPRVKPMVTTDKKKKANKLKCRTKTIENES